MIFLRGEAMREFIADENTCGAKSLFATHYHELSELEGQLPGVKNYRISVKEIGEDILFLRKIVRGSADKSFGVQVARLAGIPPNKRENMRGPMSDTLMRTGMPFSPKMSQKATG